MHTENLTYQCGGATLESYVAYDANKTEKRPLVLIAHAWTGRNEFECKKAETLAAMGYVGVALDVYGKGVLGEAVEECAALMQPFMDDRQLLLDRLNAGIAKAKEISVVDTSKIAVIGFCFGGLAAIDIARSGADVKGVVSFHGLFFPPEKLPKHKIKAKVLALHGYDDPMATPDQMTALASELTEGGGDWQIHAYGNTVHAFTHPDANDVERGCVYSEKADKRSWQAMTNFLNELFNG